MRTLTLYANECGMQTDMHSGKPTIAPDTARQFVDEYAPWAARWKLVCGGIKCWESVDDYERWAAQK